VEKLGGENLAQHRIAEELQSLVVGTGVGVFVKVARVSEGLDQQRRAGKNVTEADLEGCERTGHEEALE
jgi:hypothetical protein